MADLKSLGEFELLVMAALLRLGDLAYGVAIMEELENRTGRVVATGALYATLNRLEKKGLVQSRLGEATAARGGRAKRYYAITALGSDRLKHSVSVISAMFEGIDGYGLGSGATS